MCVCVCVFVGELHFGTQVGLRVLSPGVVWGGEGDALEGDLRAISEATSDEWKEEEEGRRRRRRKKK